MKVALIIVLLLCLMLILIGVSLWWIPSTQLPDLVKLIYSMLCCGSGIAFGAIIIEELRDEF